MARRHARLAVAGLAVLASAACGGGQDIQLKSPAQQAVGHNDINPRPVSALERGGTLQWPLDSMPVNWNYDQIDGASLETFTIVNAIEPYLFPAKADGSIGTNPDYLLAADLVTSDPQVVELKLNPKAQWSNGRKLDWTDLRAQWQALSGADKKYAVAQTSGYEKITKVERGSDDQDVRITFGSRFAEWRGLFSPLYPRELNATADSFNKSWADAPRISAGPFKLDKIDQVGKTARLVRDPAWWGKPAQLDSIVFKVVNRPARADALASGAIDFADANGSVDLVKRASTMPGVVLRQAVTPDTYHLTPNGGAGRILSDQVVRLALLKAVDRNAITKAEAGPLTADAQPAGNHFYPQGSKDYQDHSNLVGFDPEQAKKDLDVAGWRLEDGQFRVRDGKPLALSFVIPAETPSSRDIANLVSRQLASVGAKVTINAVPPAEFYSNYIEVGNFDLTCFRWLATPLPISGNVGTYGLNLTDPADVRSNYGRVGNKEINDLFDQANAELDDTKRAELSQRIDRELWRIGSELTLYQLPGAVAVRSKLANFGAFGFAQFPIDYASIGFTG